MLVLNLSLLTENLWTKFIQIPPLPQKKPYETAFPMYTFLGYNRSQNIGIFSHEGLSLSKKQMAKLQG